MNYKAPSVAELQAQCDAFNAACPVGGRVAVNLDFVDAPRITTTRSEAQILSGHSAVVWMDGVRGCYDLSRVTPIPAPAADEWTTTPPTEQGEYWHWNGNPDSAPSVLSILYSGSALKCFVPMNQTNSGHAEMCDAYGGHWLRLRAPRLPITTTE